MVQPSTAERAGRLRPWHRRDVAGTPESEERYDGPSPWAWIAFGGAAAMALLLVALAFRAHRGG